MDARRTCEPVSVSLRSRGLRLILQNLFFLAAASLSLGQVGPVRIQVSPMNASVALGGAQTFFATAPGFFRGPRQSGGPISVTWSSSNPSVANIDAQTGAITTTGQGTTTISARHGPFQGSTTLLVGISSISISPVNPVISLG